MCVSLFFLSCFWVAFSWLSLLGFQRREQKEEEEGEGGRLAQRRARGETRKGREVCLLFSFCLCLGFWSLEGLSCQRKASVFFFSLLLLWLCFCVRGRWTRWREETGGQRMRDGWRANASLNEAAETKGLVDLVGIGQHPCVI